MARKKITKLCSAQGCQTEINRHQAFCRTHWFWLPKPLRDAIYETWRKGRTKNWLENMTEARRLIAERIEEERTREKSV